MAKETIHIAVLTCKGCGAPMHPDPQALAFSCPFCGSQVPYSSPVAQSARALRYKHRVPEVQDGLVKLIRVAVMEKVPPKSGNTLLDPRRRWARSLADYIRATDRRAYVTRRDRFEFTFVCPHCGAPVPGSSTQTMYTCESCGSVYGLDRLEDLELGKFPQIVGNESMVPSQCLPFEVTYAQAVARVRYATSQDPAFFAGFDVEALLRAGALTAVYAPAQLADLALRVSVDCSRGKEELYLEWIDWVYPTDGGLDMTLVDDMAPWDFNRAGTFFPELAMGDTIILASTNYIGTVDTLDALLAEAVPLEIERSYGARKVVPLLWSRDLVKHDSGSIALPVYHLEQHDAAGGGLRIMVNGQTGRVSAITCENGVERRFALPGVDDGKVDGERTMKSAPVPVRYVKPSHLYAVMGPDEAFGGRTGRQGASTSGKPEKKGLFGRFFGRG